MIISKMLGIQRMEWERINIATMVILILATINSLRLRFTRLDGANGAARLVRVDEFPVHKYSGPCHDQRICNEPKL